MRCLAKRTRWTIAIQIKNIAIEVDGIYWHSSEKSLERDGVKDNLCKDIGITLLRFTDIEIDRDFEVVKNKIVGIFL